MAKRNSTTIHKLATHEMKRLDKELYRRPDEGFRQWNKRTNLLLDAYGQEQRQQFFTWRDQQSKRQQARQRAQNAAEARTALRDLIAEFSSPRQVRSVSRDVARDVDRYRLGILEHAAKLSPADVYCLWYGAVTLAEWKYNENRGAGAIREIIAGAARFKSEASLIDSEWASLRAADAAELWLQAKGYKLRVRGRTRTTPATAAYDDDNDPDGITKTGL
jgi:hypothetical protein